jgi:hypothetical protein
MYFLNMETCNEKFVIKWCHYVWTSQNVLSQTESNDIIR